MLYLQVFYTANYTLLGAQDQDVDAQIRKRQLFARFPKLHAAERSKC